MPRLWCRRSGPRRRKITLHDIPCFGRPARLIWAKRLWRCPDERCPRKVFSEEHPLAGKRAILTNRAVRWTVDALEKYDASVSVLAHQLGVSWRALWKGIEVEATRRIRRPERLAGIDALGVDEHVWTHTGFPGTGMVTGIIDHTRDAHGNVHARLLDLVSGRSGKAYGDWLNEQGPTFTTSIKVATLDPFRGYANAIRDGLPEAITVVDAFHIVKLGTGMVDEVRRRVQQDTLGHRGRKNDPLYGIRRTLQQGIESLTEKQVARLEIKLEAGDPNSEVAIAWHSSLPGEITQPRLETKGLISPTARTARCMPGCSRGAVSIKACSRSRTGTRSPGDGPGRGDAEAAAWRVRGFMRCCR